MSACHVCGSKEFHTESIDEVFTFSDRHVLVEGIPAEVCSRCGEIVISRNTTERVRTMLHDRAQPDRIESLDVFALA